MVEEYREEQGYEQPAGAYAVPEEESELATTELEPGAQEEHDDFNELFDVPASMTEVGDDLFEPPAPMTDEDLRELTDVGGDEQLFAVDYEQDVLGVSRSSEARKPRPSKFAPKPRLYVPPVVVRRVGG